MLQKFSHSFQKKRSEERGDSNGGSEIFVDDTGDIFYGNYFNQAFQVKIVQIKEMKESLYEALNLHKCNCISEPSS